MKELSQQELKEVSGGGITFGAAALVTMGVIFVIGIVDGFVRPLKCQ